MQRVISISNPQLSSAPLVERLNASIGETSNDIGNLIGELVNRSLKVGVSDLGDSLAEFAEEQVEVAVQKQMPSITEAADAVAQSTAQLVVQQSVAVIADELSNQKQALEAKIEAAESGAWDRARVHVDEVVSEVRVRLDETRNLAIQGQDTSEKKIQLLRERGKQTWQKFQSEFTSIHNAYDKLCAEHAQLRHEHAGLVEKLVKIDEANRQDSQASRQKLAAVLEQNQLFEKRLALLEQPRGITRLFAKLKGKGKSPKIQSLPSQADIDPT